MNPAYPARASARAVRAGGVRVCDLQRSPGRTQLRGEPTAVARRSSPVRAIGYRAPMSFVIKVLVTAAAVWVAVELIDGLEFDGTWVGLIAIAVILGVVNAFARPIVTILSLPLVLLTLGLFLLIINAFMLGLTIWISEALDLGLTSTGFGATLFGAIIITVVSWIGEALLGVD